MKTDQPGCPNSLTRILAVRTTKHWVLISNPLSAQRRLISLGGCPCWSELSLGVHVIFYVLPCSGSIIKSHMLSFRAAVTTLNGSMGGGVAGIIISYVIIFSAILDNVHNNLKRGSFGNTCTTNIKSLKTAEQSRFDWVCSWVKQENTTSFTSPIVQSMIICTFRNNE